MTDEEKKQVVNEAADETDGKKKLACAQAFKISKEHGIALKDIRKLCDENGIKIYRCQLGCFG